ncbi:MAG TPA: MFS transporter [Candidatus Nanoarchaeia archaeon]|nr:MFS transporter [Candidatus Nanoarchaeia archaeon]
MKDPILSNIWKLYILKSFRWFMLWAPIIVLFYQENGLSMRDIFLLQAIFSIILLVFDVPTGFLADRFGRKPIILLACIMGLFGFITYSFSYNFLGFLMAEVLLGISSSLISGADSALIYDSLVQAGKEKQYKKYEGRLSGLGYFSEAMASVIGGGVALISLRWTIYSQVGLELLTIPLALSLIEPKRHSFRRVKAVKFAIKTVKYALHEHIEIKWLILYSAIIYAATLITIWFVQPYLKMVGIPLFWFGIIWAIMKVSMAACSWWAHRLETYLGRRASLISLLIGTVAGCVLAAVFQSVWGIVFLLLFYSVRGFSEPVFKDYINRLVSSDRRATVLSTRTMVSRLLYVALGPFLGWIMDVYSLRLAFFVSGGISLFLGLIALLYMYKHKTA